jgi:SAM-dependent methyltransferase
MEVHQYFRPKNEQEGIECAVGSCNTFDRDTRNRLETPLFAKAIYAQLPESVKPGAKVLDYGCGFGRIAKALRDQAPDITIHGTDASPEALHLAAKRVAEPSLFMLPEDIDTETDWKYDLVYSIYVLQHIPALYLRDALQRIHYHLREGGKFIVCTSMYRLAMGPDGFHDDRRLNYVDMKAEIERYFVIEGDLFSPADLKENDILEAMIHGRGPGGLDHPAWICRKRAIAGPLFDAFPAASAVPQEAKTANPRVITPAPAPAARPPAAASGRRCRRPRTHAHRDP